MSMNLDTIIKDMKGADAPMSLPTQADLDAIKEEKNLEKVTVKDLPRETVRNVLINSLANYIVTDRAEVFTVHALGSALVSDGDFELSDKHRDFLAKRVLPQVTVRMEGEGEKAEQKGIYTPWVIAQVYAALGVTE